MELIGKSAVVTGAGHGIGRAVALALADEGVNVAVVDVVKEAALQVAEAVRERGVAAVGLAADVSDEAQMDAVARAAWEAFSEVHILMNNAGVMPDTGPLYAASDDDFQWVFGVNVRGMLNGVRAFTPRFLASGQQCWIINTGSEHSFGVPHLGGGLYTASKHAVLGLTDVLARELPENVGVSILCPGIVETTLWRSKERRPSEFGGSADVPAEQGAAMRYGMDVEIVAACVVRGLREETFYMLPHSHVVDIAHERWQNAEDAFAQQAPRMPGDDAYDVNQIIERLRKGD